MTPNELRLSLAAYRKEVEKAWTPATAHPDYNGADGSPVGQCGVTSAWLQRRLVDDHAKFTLYCEGTVYFGATSARHVWLADLDGSIFDLTADQFPAPVTAYIAERALMPREVSREPVRDRLALLEEAL